MDTMKFLLGATAALLFGAVVVSWQGMKRGVENASPEEIKKLEQQIAELREEFRESRPQQAAPTSSQGSEEVSAKLAAALAEIDRLNAERESSLDTKLKIDEEGLIAQKKLEQSDDELKRARWIADALLIGHVKEYVEDPTYGGFITIRVLMPEQVQVGTILGIRRKTGVLGQFKVSDVTPDGAIANPLTTFGEVKPVPGDELIFPPIY